MFEIKHESQKARSAILKTSHGKIKTPFFMPVATKASVKGVEGETLEDIGFEALISNSFILSMNPGIKTIEGLGGIHKFMNFHKSIVTDSGGFQVLSKEFLVKKSDEGAIFKNPKTGKKDLFTPEISMENQVRIGSDIAMTLDDVPHHDLDGKDYVHSIKRTHAWAERCLKTHKELKESHNSKQLLFGITQGGTRKEYRTFSTNKLNKMDFDGVALGGMVIGESREELLKTVKLSIENLDNHKVKYLMGLGSPSDIVKAVGMGVDCFDSTYPTANARHGSLLTDNGRIKILKKEYSDDPNPIMEGCKCSVCKNYSRAYVHYQLRNHELVGYRLATIHNIFYMNNLMVKIRKAIKKDEYQEFENEYIKNYFSEKENKEFQNNIKDKYYQKDEKQRPIYLLDHKNE
jgi:queuine tRNA-ribosyltransferase